MMRRQAQKTVRQKLGVELTNVKVLTPRTIGSIAEQKSPFWVCDLRRTVRRVPVDTKQKK
jgi:hypothetical protein